jgi:uncharacterized phage infection (PIP) family protein YhgE
MTNGTQGSGPKRPHATIEGKATEIKPEPAKPAASSAAANPSTDQRTTAEKVAGAAASVATDSKKTEAPKAAGASASAASTSSASKASSPPPPPAKSGGFGSIVSHTVAGVVGGALVLLAGPLLGLGGSDTTKVSPEVTQRLATLEDAARKAAQPVVSPEIAKRLAGLEQGVDQLKGITAAIPGLGEGQVRLDGEAKALKDQLASRTGPGSDAERLARMEERLSALAAAALADPKGAGPIPQLAQITGRIADLESALTNRLTAARRDMGMEIESKLASTAEAAEAARSGTQRIDREVTTLKSDVTRTTQRVDQLKGDSDRLSEVARSAQDEIATLKSALDTLRRETAKPADVSAAVAPAAARLAKLEDSVTEVLKAEADRQSNAERIVLSLELGNLKRAIDRGGAFTAELAEVRKVAGNRLDLSVLQRYQDEGLPTIADLARQFRPLTGAIIDADAERQDASVVDRLMSGARTIVRVRKLTPEADDTSVEATVARMESALNDGRLADVMRHAKTLPAKSVTGPTRTWLDKVAARQSVEEAIVNIDRQLKSSLGAAPAAKDAKQ